MMSSLHHILKENLARVHQRIAEAARRAGRAPEEISLVAVTKYVPIEIVKALIDLGQTRIGESRPQQLWQRAELLAGSPIRWHLVGHLQRNKVRRTLPLVDMIHSIDSERLLRTVDNEAERFDSRVPVLLEVNVSGDPAKHGFAPDDLHPLAPRLHEFAHADVQGLMCMAGVPDDRDAARRDFARLRQLRERLARELPDELKLPELSMGMSGDFEEAIGEGATIVRLGSILFEGCQ